MKIVVAGGTGQLGLIVQRSFLNTGHEVVILSRTQTPTSLARIVIWDGRTLGPWADEIDGADVVINLAGRSVNCRYTKSNLSAMMLSRVESTRVIGAAIARAAKPPSVWLQMSTATIYAHRFDAANDEITGILGGAEPGVPRYWDASIAIARTWEEALSGAATPRTRKVALRTAMVMSPNRGGVFATLATLASRGLGGPHGSGNQFVSWIHEQDFVAAIRFLIEHSELTGPINLCAPNPLPNHDFQATLRRTLGMKMHLPTPAWILEFGAFFMRTDTELLLKSRRVVPGRLVAAGFRFDFPAWTKTATHLADAWRTAEM